MKALLLILGILGIVLTIASSGLSLLFLYAYMYTMDAPFETYQMQKTAFIVLAIVAVVLLIGTIFIFAKYKKVNKH